MTCIYSCTEVDAIKLGHSSNFAITNTDLFKVTRNSSPSCTKWTIVIYSSSEVDILPLVHSYNFVLVNTDLNKATRNSFPTCTKWITIIYSYSVEDQILLVDSYNFAITNTDLTPNPFGTGWKRISDDISEIRFHPVPNGLGAFIPVRKYV